MSIEVEQLYLLQGDAQEYEVGRDWGFRRQFSGEGPTA